MVLVFRTVGELSRAAAEFFVAAARRSAAERGRFHVALSGGRTPRRLFALLAGPEYSPRIPWDATHVFWADERLVPISSPASNAGLAERLLLRRVPLPREHIHEMPADLPPREAATAYGSELRRFFRGSRPAFDLVLLGLGENGHTASLFPGARALGEKKKWVLPVRRRGEPFSRLTLTATALSGAREVVFVVFGSAKARALRGTLAPEHRPRLYPARLVRPSAGRVEWLVDQRAARLLTHCELAGD